MSNRISYCRILTPQVVLLAASASLFAQRARHWPLDPLRLPHRRHPWDWCKINLRRHLGSKLLAGSWFPTR